MSAPHAPRPFAMPDEEHEAYAAWREQVRTRPLAAGWNGVLLVIFTLVATVAGALYFLRFFPAGRYPRIILAAPGLTAGWLFYTLTARLFFKLRPPR